MSYLATSDLSVTFYGNEAVNHVNFTVEPGEFLAVLGANGSGKSTLLRACLGIIPTSHGTVDLFDTPIDRFDQWHRIGYVPQKFYFESGIPATVREVVTSGRLSHRRLFRRATATDQAAIDHALDLVDLTNKSSEPISFLSGGQHQRALIARALATKPDLLILDESTAGIDDNQLLRLRDVFTELMSSGTSIVLITHELGIFEPLAKRAIVIDHGRIVHDGEVMAGRL